MINKLIVTLSEGEVSLVIAEQGTGTFNPGDVPNISDAV